MLSSPGSPPSGPSPGVSFADRCGDLALSRAGPKPRQTRDGHSWRMGSLFSFCPRALSLLRLRPPWRCVGGAGGMTCRLRPDPAFPRSASRRSRDRGPLTQQTLSLAFRGFVCGARSSPRRGGPSRRRAAHPLGRVLSARCASPFVVPLERSRLSQVPETEPVASFPVPSDPFPRATVVGGVPEERVVESVREAHPAPPVGRGRLVVPCRAPAGAGGGLDLAGRVSGCGGPSQRCGAWPAEGRRLFCPAARRARLRFLVPPPKVAKLLAGSVTRARRAWRGKGGLLVGSRPRALRMALCLSLAADPPLLPLSPGGLRNAVLRGPGRGGERIGLGTMHPR